MSVIIPAILRALNVGDPFMQEDTVGPNFSTSIEIARMTSTRIELGLLNIHSTGVTDSGESEGAIETVASRQRRDSVGLGVKDDRKHQITTQTSDGSLGNSRTTKVVPLADESDITDSLAQVRSLPVVEQDQSIEAGVEKNVKRNSI